MMHLNRFWMAMVCLVFLAAAAVADDWPQWRGPERNGISQETGLLSEWPEEGPKLVWQVRDVGTGYSTPSVVGDRLYLLGNEGMEDEFVQARNVSDGSLVWSVRLGKVGKPDQRPPYPGARSTPTVDGDVLYALGSDGDLACIEIEDGTIRWQKNIREELNGESGTWAYAESPLIDGEVLVCTPGGDEATMVALNKKSGEAIWKCPIEGGEAGYASPIIIEVDGVKQYVQFLAEGVGLVGVNAETGELLWRYGRTAQGSPANIPTPVADNGYVYSAASRSGGGLVHVSSEGGKMAAEEVYFSPNLPSDIGGSILLGEYLYGTDGEVFQCVEFKTGKTKWQQRSIGAASLCYADGHLYLHGDEDGEVALIEATPEGYRQKGLFTPSNLPENARGRGWPYPVVANGRLYIRHLDSLWSFDISANN